MHVAKSGRIIVKLNSARSNLIGNILIDSEGRKVGKVIETIGPVSSPYASVAPVIEKTNSQLCVTYQDRIDQLNAIARQPQSAQTQDWIREEILKIRDADRR